VAPQYPFIYIADGPKACYDGLAETVSGIFPLRITPKESVVGDTLMSVSGARGSCDNILILHQGLIRVYETPGLARRCAVAGIHLRSGRLCRSDDTWNGTPISNYDTDGLTADVKLVNQRALSGGRNGGLIILDVSNPHNPRYVASYRRRARPGNFVQDENFTWRISTVGDLPDQPDGVSPIETLTTPKSA